MAIGRGRDGAHHTTTITTNTTTIHKQTLLRFQLLMLARPPTRNKYDTYRCLIIITIIKHCCGYD